ncbi:MAG: twin-arginine translocation signal domain-containing protein [Verrucomicrobia bacterium]|nr:twin-arginine translocation signal domain-containing protein [Verrucomicrobiota bacterium]
MRAKHSSNAGGIQRRDFLKGTATALAAAVAAPLNSDAAETQPTPRQFDLIKKENAKPGALDWQLTRVRLDKNAGFRSPRIEGYCSHQSIEAGQTLDIFVSTNPAQAFSIEFFRMGYYGGRGASLMTTMGPFKGIVQPDPPIGEMRLRECKWTPSASLKIPADWPSGVYLGRLTTAPDKPEQPYWQSYIVFIVRDRRRADILFQCCDNTWAAYNRWPNDYSLYTDPRGAHARDVSVSFDRPYGKYAQIFEHPLSIGSGEFLLWEFPLAFWLEQHGYDVTYCSNSDLLDPAQAKRAKIFASVGHDEYWDTRQYDAVKDAIASGVNALWLSGNSVFAVSAFTPSSSGRANRIITRTGHFAGLTNDEVAEEQAVFTKNYLRVGPDESLIIGARSIVPFNGGGDWVCTRPDHWLFFGTGMKKGDAIPGLVGWEHHGAPAKIPGLEVVAEGTSWKGGVNPAHWTATIFPGPKKNIVFNAATIFWAQGLSSPPGHILPWSHWSRPHGPDERVQRITQNAIRRMLA